MNGIVFPSSISLIVLSTCFSLTLSSSAIILIIFSIPAYGVTFDEYYPDDEKPNKPLYIRQGSFIRVVNLREINSFIADIGDECEFINKYDLPRSSSVKTAIDILIDKDLLYQTPSGYIVYDHFLELWLRRL